MSDLREKVSEKAVAAEGAARLCRVCLTRLVNGCCDYVCCRRFGELADDAVDAVNNAANKQGVPVVLNSTTDAGENVSDIHAVSPLREGVFWEIAQRVENKIADVERRSSSQRSEPTENPA